MADHSFSINYPYPKNFLLWCITSQLLLSFYMYYIKMQTTVFDNALDRPNKAFSTLQKTQFTSNLSRLQNGNQSRVASICFIWQLQLHWRLLDCHPDFMSSKQSSIFPSQNPLVLLPFSSHHSSCLPHISALPRTQGHHLLNNSCFLTLSAS